VADQPNRPDAEGWAPPDPDLPQQYPTYPHRPGAEGTAPPDPEPQPYPGYPQQPYPGYPQPYPAYPQQPYQPYPPRPEPPRVVPAPPGEPFHRLARTPLHRWWRPLAGTLLIVALVFAAGLLVGIGAAIVQFARNGPDALDDGGGESLFGGPTGLLGWNLAILAALTPCVLLAVRVVQRRPVGSVTSVAGRLRWRWLFTCCGLAVGFCVVVLVLSYAASAVFGGESGDSEVMPEWAGWDAFWVPALVIVLLVPLQATGEEFAFRGWLLQGIAAWTLETRTGRVARALSRVLRMPWPAVVVSAALFTSMHGYTGWAMFEIFCFGLLTGWLAVRTGGLEAGIALHIFNNLMGLLLVAASGRISDALEQGGMPWTYFVLDVIALGLYVLAVDRVARRRGLPRVSSAP
jgi:membrane protease YdiL (CAAX protease family)